jgi:hypothetical protein
MLMNTSIETLIMCYHSNAFGSSSGGIAFKEMEGLVALELSAEISKTGAPKKAFPVPANPQMTRCFTQFNPSGKDMFDKTLNHWSSAYLSILDRLPASHAL